MRAFLQSLTVVVFLSVAGCAGIRDTKVTQFSTIDALLAGVYDGDFSCAQVLRQGSLGLGTFDRLDGEMVVMDGRVYQVRGDGSVHRVPLPLKTPFATVARFHPESVVRTSKCLNKTSLERELDRICSDPNGIYAIRLSGTFSVMKTRSVTAQKKPYPELVEAAKFQSVFELGPAKGTVVGFRFPTYFKGLNVPGYHLHFLSQDRRHGGHILDLTADSGCVIESADCRRFELRLPGSGSGFSRASLERDRSVELHQVER